MSGQPVRTIDLLELPLARHAITEGAAAALRSLSRAIEWASQGRELDRCATLTGLQALLELRSCLRPVPPDGEAWAVLELPGLGRHCGCLRLESPVGDALTIQIDAHGTPTVATWHRIGSPQAAIFYLRREPRGWELVVSNGPTTYRHPVVLPDGAAWAQPPVSADAAVVAAAGGASVGTAPESSPCSKPPGTEGRPLVTLVFQSGPTPFEPVPLTGRVVVGREAGCDLWLDDPGVSRHHAAFEPTAGGARVTDLGSSNGTFLNGRRLEAPAELAEGDEVLLGHTHLGLGRRPEEQPPPAPTGQPAPVNPLPEEPLPAPARAGAGRTCPGCGRVEPDPAVRFCRGCGKALPTVAPTAAPLACARCGTPLGAGVRFCTRCGRKVG